MARAARGYSGAVRAFGLVAALPALACAAAPSTPRPCPSVDVVLVVDTVHHLEDRTACFAKLVPTLRDGGRVVVVDFGPRPLEHGPPEAHRVPPVLLEEEMRAAGHDLIALDEGTLPRPYVAIFRPTQRAVAP